MQNQLGGLPNSVKPEPQSEIARENDLLEKAIQETFESARQLSTRLQPFTRSYPTAPGTDKMPEEAMSDFGANLRRHRRAVESIRDTIALLLQNLAV